MQQFAVGDMIDWNDCGKYFTDSAEMIRDYGPGPFQVEIIREVPEELIWAAGHMQWLIISKEINGVKCAYNPDENQWVADQHLREFSFFSGAHFKKV